MAMTPEHGEPERDELLDEMPEIVPINERPLIRERKRMGPGAAGGCALLVLGVVVGGLAGFALLMVVGRVWVSADEGMLHRLASLLTGRSTTIDVSQAAVVERIRKLSRLETVEYSMDKIVEGERERDMGSVVRGACTAAGRTVESEGAQSAIPWADEVERPRKS